jgi:signal transduction histidine kinase
VGALAATLSAIPGVRPPDLDDARSFSLALLMFTIISASAIAHYVAIRDATIRAVELSPLEPIMAWLERDALRLAPRRRVVRKILLAVVVPVALVGTATVLVAHAHLRAFMESSRHDTALQLARIALDPVPGPGDSGTEDAVAAAAAHGFFVRFEPSPDSEAVTDELATQKRLITDQLETTLVTTYGKSSIRYEASLSADAVTTGVWLALLAVLLAAAFGGAFGRVLAADLVLATQQVSTLGTDVVMRGQARVAGPARFAVVSQLGRSVEVLAERFRVFAAAQERALQAKAASRRMKQLLFASVSHDLKSPLNAVLGFAELVREEPLSSSQAESLDLVQGRGRELLALIETILDAARVEAGQLQLMPAPTDIDDLVGEALETARNLLAERKLEVIVEMARGIPPLQVDSTYGGRAIAVLIAHAMQTATGARGRSIRVRGSMPAREQYAGGTMARVDIEYVTEASRPSMLEAQLAGKLTTGSGRGMVLRLSLARTIIELHGGLVEVGRGPHGAAVVTCWLPIATAANATFEEATTRVMPSKKQAQLEKQFDMRAPIDSQAGVETTVMKKT